MADRTANTTFYPSTNPMKIPFKANLEDNDTILVPYGVPIAVIGLNSEDTDDIIATAACSGGTITFGLIDDEGSGYSTDTDIVGEVVLKSQ